MIPVMQTKFGSGDGNCFAACIASLLGIPLERCGVDGTGKDWLQKTNRWLVTIGLFYLEVCVSADQKIWPITHLPRTHCVMIGSSPRFPNVEHAVIAQIYTNEDNQIFWRYVHDPHPEGGFIENVTGIGFLIPMDAGEWPLKDYGSA